ncbi:YesL family protein [Sporosarcina sp. NPDC096371]|uniref:YesL family protein n=1 Tax=Sporosarcina sp. NPDC096371 TaxID=3364530 RepID=UPI00381634BF
MESIEVKIMDNTLYKTMEFLKNIFLLNTIWLLMCIPIVTIFPATTAMFAVLREWKTQGDIQVLSAYIRFLKESFKQGFFIGIVWLVFTSLLLGDFIITNQLNSNLKYVLFSFFFLLTIVYLFVTIMIFPVMAHYRVSWKGAIKNAFLLSVANLHYTILSLLILAATILLCFYFPGATLLSFSMAAFLINALVSRGFQRVNETYTSEQTAEVSLGKLRTPAVRS